jgi:hypothetical protein
VRPRCFLFQKRENEILFPHKKKNTQKRNRTRYNCTFLGQALCRCVSSRSSRSVLFVTSLVNQ